MRAASIAALLPVMALVGCGGASDSSTQTVTVGSTTTAEPLTKGEYIEQADAICREFDAQLDPLGDKVQAQFEASDYDAAADTLAEAVDVARPGLEQLEALPKPPNDDAALEQLDDLRQQQVALLERGEDAVRDQDASRISSIFDELDAVDERSDGIATGYGFQECGQGTD